jgi:hypothetical protein
MPWQLGRRVILGTLVVLVAASAAVSTGGDARAEAKDPIYVGGYGSKAAFQESCNAGKGTFSEDGLGNTNCHFKDGGWTQCNEKGNDCYYTPPPEREAVDDPLWQILDGPLPLTPITAAPVSVVDGPVPSSAQPSLAAPDDDRDQDHGKRKGKGKKSKRGGKGRK